MMQEKDDLDLDPDGDDDNVELRAKDLMQIGVFFPRSRTQQISKVQKSFGMITLQLITLSVYRVVGPSPDPSRITYYPGITQT
ncbi:MAG: hypothetical protein EZS28_048674 [Streblomastix strix]|uniref:Uncharacterized protein n=1 Tax=Streblomastix strix TaxID=222440 RepID=A0A5J4TDX2_9EUKA|nr:MAG: hypothetical protein EZS28_048674 [Streblomastix strix]